MCRKCNQLCGWINRSILSKDIYVIKTLWNTLIQPRIDYCSQLWAPYKQGQIQKLEGTLRSYTAKIPNLDNLNYWERLEHLHMFSIQRRMERYRIIYTWKAIEGLVPNFGIITAHSIRKGRLCQIPKLNTKSSRAVQTIKENSLFIRGPQLFNSLPINLREMADCTSEVFKRNLDKHLQTIPDEPRCPGYTQLSRTENNITITIKF